MSTPSHAIPGASASSAAVTKSPAARGNDAEPAGLEGLFARISADMEAASHAEETTPATEAATDSEQSPEAQAGAGDLAENLDSTDLTPAVTADIDADLPADDAVVTAADNDTAADSQPTVERGVQHAIAVVESIQNQRSARLETQDAAGRPDPLINALRALNQTAEPGSRPLPATASATAADRQPQVHIASETPLRPAMPVAAQRPFTTEQLQQIINKSAETVVTIPEFQAPETPAAGNQNHVITQLGASNQTLTRVDGTTTVIKMDMPGNIQQPAWQQALAERVVFAAGKHIRQAEIQLHPAELGVVNVRIEASHDRAAVQFTAMHADAREALDAALPKLREMFNQQGMDLVHADVQQNTGNPQDSQSWQSALMPEAEVNPGAMDSTENLTATARQNSNPDAIVDLYA